MLVDDDDDELIETLINTVLEHDVDYMYSGNVSDLKTLARAYHSEKTKLRPMNEYDESMGAVLWFMGNVPYEVNDYNPVDRGAATTHFQQININENLSD